MHEIYFLNGETEFVNLEEHRFAWIDGIAGSPLDESDMPVVLREGDTVKARWRNGDRMNPEHYNATITSISRNGASIEFARRALGMSKNVCWNDIEQCRVALTDEIALTLRPGDVVSARWPNQASIWPGWYPAKVIRPSVGGIVGLRFLDKEVSNLGAIEVLHQDIQVTCLS